jgi:uncharacterized phiE125 gp8 family phage protein
VKRYIRVVSQVLLAACSFGVQIARYSSNVTEDAVLSGCITTARQWAEDITRRKFITETCFYYLDEFPKGNEIKLPYGQLQTITSVKYKDSTGVETTMIATTDYLVDSTTEPGRIIRTYQGSWPTAELYPVNPITIEYVCGYGAAADVPVKIRTAIKMQAANFYEHRGETFVGVGQSVIENKTAYNLLMPYRLWEHDFDNAGRGAS